MHLHMFFAKFGYVLTKLWPFFYRPFFCLYRLSPNFIDFQNRLADIESPEVDIGYRLSRVDIDLDNQYRADIGFSR